MSSLVGSFMKMMTSILMLAFIVGVHFLVTSGERVQEQACSDPSQLSLGPLNKALIEEVKAQAYNEVLRNIMNDLTKQLENTTLKAGTTQAVARTLLKQMYPLEEPANSNITSVLADFIKFVKDHKKNYTSCSSLAKHYAAFTRSYAGVEEANKNFAEGKSLFSLELNLHADNYDTYVDDLEFWEKIKRLSFLLNHFVHKSEDYKSWKLSSAADRAKLPDDNSYDLNNINSVDYRHSRGECLGRIRAQKSCGSCFIFATLQVIEAQACMKKQHKFELSPQHVVDNLQYGGCNGGFETQIIDLYNERKSMILEHCYPYTASYDNQTRPTYSTSFSADCHVPAQIQSSKLGIVILRGPEEIAEAIRLYGPVVGSMIMSNWMLLYKSGIYTDNEHCPFGKQSGHAVVLVGYGKENDIPYWLAKNSHGANWGENGYFRILRGNNTCLIDNKAYLIY